MQTGFVSSYLSKEKSFLVQMKDKFGRITVTHCSKHERDTLKKEFNKIQKEVSVSNVVNHIPKRRVGKKRIARETGFVIPDTSYYVIENFSANLFSDDGVLLNVIELGKYILMPRWYEKKLNIDSDQVSFFKIIDIDEELCLVILLPKLIFRDSKIGFSFPYVLGSSITYLQAKKICKQINRYGFQKTIVHVCQIPKSEVLGNPFATAEVIKRISGAHKRREQEKNQIMRNSATHLKSRKRKEKYAIKSHTSKVYFSASSNERINNRIGNKVDRKLQEVK